MFVKSRPIYPVSDDLKLRNSTELRSLSEQLSRLIDKTGEIEEHINTLELAKSYRMEKKANKQKLLKQQRQSDSDEFSLNGLDLDISETSPNQTNTDKFSSFTSQLVPAQQLKRRKKPEPTLREILTLINTMRKNVSELVTRQNEMKFELEKIRARLC